MKYKDVKRGQVAIPETEEERKCLESLVSKGVVEYYEGGYWLTKKGMKIAKKMDWSEYE